jgi:hypothetical protein
MEVTGAQDRRLEAIAAAGAAVLAQTEYHEVRTQDIAARVRLNESGDGRSAGGRRSAVWLYNEARSRRVLVALAARHAWTEYLAQADRTPALGPDGAGDPETLTEAVELVAAALLEIARFHRASQFLMRQVGLGIGDIATSEKRAGANGQQALSWPDSVWGFVAADGFDGRCSAFADYLAPVLFAAARVVCPMTHPEAQAQARVLSDLAFRALLSERDGPLDGISDGLAAYWFEHDLVRAAGQWIRRTMAAEHGLARGVSRARDPRAAAMALGILADILRESGALYARCAAVGAARIQLLAQLTHYPPPVSERESAEEPGPRAEPADLRALCDAASRQGLALHGFGDLTGADEAHRLSRAVAEQELARYYPGEAESYAARANHNLAGVALDRAAYTEAATLCESVYGQRKRWLADGSAAAWRRYSLTAELRARIAVARGRPGAGVSAAQALFDERQERFGGTDNASVTAARVVLGQALHAAGHPRAARYQLEAARRFHESRSAAFGLVIQRELIDLAEIALALDDPAQAERLLPAEDAVEWITGHVSFRLAATIRRLRATTFARTNRTDQAKELIDRAIAEFPKPGPGQADQLVLGLDRCRSEVLWRDGRPEAAAAILGEVRAAEASLDNGAFSVASAVTLRQLARCADSAGDTAAAVRYHTELRVAADGALEPAHVVLLSADLDQARRLLGTADIDGAGRLVAALLDRRPLPHGRPALEDGHPLLTAARRLAEEIGLPPADPMDHDWGEE